MHNFTPTLIQPRKIIADGGPDDLLSLRCMQREENGPFMGLRYRPRQQRRLITSFPELLSLARVSNGMFIECTATVTGH
jgi:hypothetical protein